MSPNPSTDTSTDVTTSASRIQHPLSKALPSRPLGPMRAPARALAWFGIAIGLAELAMPRALGRAAGMPNVPRLTRAFGLREIGTGIGILTSRDPSPWLWGRVAGDALDVATVATGLLTERRPVRTLTTLAMLAGIAYVDMQVAKAAPPERKRQKHSGRDYSARSGFPKPAAEMRGVGTRPSTRMMAEGGQSGVAGAVGGGASAASTATVPMPRTSEAMGAAGQSSS